jgi:hypothetical protein
MKPIAHYYRLSVKRLLAALGLVPISGGLELTDHLIRLACYDGQQWQFSGIRLDPDVLSEGKIKNRERFVAHLVALKATMPGMQSKKKKMYVTVAMGQTAIYNQVFSLPSVEGKNFENAVQINLQMASPVDIKDVYSGWEIAGRDANLARVDILAAFADRVMVDEITRALFDAGFIALAIESKALALARMFRDKGTGADKDASYILVNIDDVGLEFLVVRGGRLYFDYATPWSYLIDEKGSVAMDKFKETFAANLRQVMNFYLQRWQGLLTGVVIASGVFVEEAMQVANQTLGLPVFSLEPMSGGQFAPEWFVAVGAGLRVFGRKGASSEMTFLGDGAQETFAKDQALRFAEFWRFLVPTFFAVLVGLFGLTYVFLLKTEASVVAGSLTGATSAQIQEGNTLKLKAASFNQSVATVKSIESSTDPKYLMLGDILQLASSSGVVVEQFSFSGYDSQASLSGQASAQQQILAFQGLIEADPRFGKVTLPLSGVQGSGGTYTFSMMFPVKRIQATSTVQ